MASSQTQQQQLYTHVSEPKAVSARRPKYRDDDIEALQYPTNIMFDRRVVRGNTYAAQVLPAEPFIKDTAPPKKKASKPRRSAPRTPEPVSGRRHMDIQTDQYLEELTDSVPEMDTFTQTDPFMDRPPTPLFIPQKSGVDATTQIENGDLFDFDFEVEPILEVLVGKTLEQGLMEVMEEEELAAMRAHQEHFEQLRNAELVATQRMEAAEKRRMEEKERRLAQERDRVQRERVVREKVAASTFAHGYLNGLMGQVFDRLYQSGFFYDPVQREVEEHFMPWLMDTTLNHLKKHETARKVAKKLIHSAVSMFAQTRAEVTNNVSQQYVSQQKYTEEELEAAKQEIEAQQADISQRAHFILYDLQPALVPLDQLEQVRTELTTMAEEEATQTWETAKAIVRENAQVEAEATLEAQRAAAAGAVDEDGNPVEDAADPGPAFDAEAFVAEAVAAVEKPPVRQITDEDVLSALMDRQIVSKDQIIHNLAIHYMGDKAYIKHPAFQSPA